MSQWVMFVTIVRKEIQRFMRIWQQTLLPSAVTTTLYFIIFGTFIGSRVGQMDGIEYMQFIVPGLVMMAVITNSYLNVCFSFFLAKFQRYIEEMLVSPTSSATIINGFVVGGVLRGLIVGIVVTLVSLLFAQLQIVHPVIMTAFVLITAILFCLLGLINGIYAKQFDHTNIVPTFVLTPLIYLGGVFYSIKLLPPLWQTISKFNPILYLVNGFRYGLFGVSDVNIWLSLVILIVLSVLSYAWAWYLVEKGVGLKE